MICIVVGTRPEIIKMAPVIRECQARKLDYCILHTGQHYSYSMDQVFFEELRLPEPEYKLEVVEDSQGAQTGEIIKRSEKVFADNPPDAVLVQGDTNTVLGAALAAVKLGIPVGHVEAGLRSFDRTMPEEINRVVADHVSDLLFAPTDVSRENLLSEGIPEERIHVTGNTIADAVLQHLKIAQDSSVLNTLGLNPREYAVLTLHRKENVDSEERFTSVIEGLERVDFDVVYPIHPRAMKNADAFGLSERLRNAVRVIEPLGYMDFLSLLTNARFVMTDSGGVQEEACILRVPCLTLRENTERPETVDIGANVIVGTSSDSIATWAGRLAGDDRVVASMRAEEAPYGDGTAAVKILDVLEEKLNLLS